MEFILLHPFKHNTVGHNRAKMQKTQRQNKWEPGRFLETLLCLSPRATVQVLVLERNPAHCLRTKTVTWFQCFFYLQLQCDSAQEFSLHCGYFLTSTINLKPCKQELSHLAPSHS